MKKILFVLTTLLTLSYAVQAGGLKFNANGEFKLMQLTDLHLNGHYPEACQEVFDRIDYMVREEAPDFIVVTGDMVYSKPAAPVIESLVKKLDSYGIPWAVAFGNHDAEQGLTRAELSELYSKGRYSLNRLDEAGELSDLEIPVMYGNEAAYYIYVMDSHDYSTIKGLDGYGWFTTDQVSWMRDCCKARTSADGSIAPSLAFFHIPLREYIDAWAPRDNSRSDQMEKKTSQGLRGENIAAGAINTGMFAAMKECGSTVGVFAGHDHDNDFVANYQGIALCYGRFSGCDAVYNNIPPGAKFICIKPGQRSFETWSRDDKGRVTVHVITDGLTLRKAPSRPKGGLHGQWTEVK